ncbi:hypothetical protein MNBD_BACTEROID03-732 [hydrothermal vent metagenome]|uniref:Solute-binding protein family 3/N-terminal domain-containing protein n=1 Tax=hydrothermal vent metagenome TaxID=652676 RepID=A0A3B0T1H7_9ZZZZ
MKNRFLILALSLLYLPLMAQTTQAQDTLLVGYTTAPPFIVQNDALLEGINIWLWQRVANDLGLKYKLVPMGFQICLISSKKEASILALTL